MICGRCGREVAEQEVVQLPLCYRCYMEIRPGWRWNGLSDVQAGVVVRGM